MTNVTMTASYLHKTSASKYPTRIAARFHALWVHNTMNDKINL